MYPIFDVATRETRFGSNLETLPKTAANDSDIDLGYGLKGRMLSLNSV